MKILKTLADGDVRVSDHCQITGKYRGSAYKDCNINVRLNHKILVVSHKLRCYDSHLIIQELGKFNLKIIAIPHGLENMSFYISNKFY